MIYAVGDIHGQRDKLRSLLGLLKEEGMSDADLLVFVGDYVDRGPNTAGVIETLLSLKASRPNTVFLRGNHEQMMLDARHRFDAAFDLENDCGNADSGIYWFTEGGQQTLHSYGSPRGRRWFEIICYEHWEFLRATKIEYVETAYHFVHAGLLPPGVKWSMADFVTDPRLWIRYEFIASDHDFDGRTVVFGHTPTRDGKPLVLKNKVAIDTGAGIGGPLTAVGLPEIYDPADIKIIQA